MKLKTCGMYMDSDIFNSFMLYASRKKTRKAYEVWADALITYMRNNPLEGSPIIIQNQIKLDLVDRLDNIQMCLIEKRLRLHMKRLVDKDGSVEYLRRAVSKEVQRGVKIKHPTAGFIELLEEAVKLV